jgi:preprotein translocase subunit Sec61beta
MASGFERLAFEASLRALDKQEKLLEELRARTGVLLAASSLVAAFLGQQGFQEPDPGALAIIALGAFVASVLASVYILYPKKALIFAESGSGLYEGLYEFREDLPEVYRRLAYDLQRFWDSNDGKIVKLTRAYAVAAIALVVEILSLAALLSGNIF